ncbi:hypothetical protein K7L04_003563 [Vibrio parahaemolyticus]|nr:hypothetical protein [Vibrio parahaemolyticus]EJC6855389.1 hypothetical protein [Vibrio parahaemolyticus]EKN4540107.1 hypothetical protein [Vibrio parahaemolyticus]
MNWIPSSPVLFQLPDTATGLDYLCTFDAESTQTVNGYSWAMSPTVPELFTITQSLSGVRLVAETLAGLFPIQFIDYRDGDEVKRVNSWPELPPGKDVIEFRPSGVTQYEYTLTVTVDYTETDELTGLETEQSATQSWRCVVLHDYSSGRAKLLEYMNHASSNKAG